LFSSLWILAITVKMTLIIQELSDYYVKKSKSQVFCILCPPLSKQILPVILRKTSFLNTADLWLKSPGEKTCDVCIWYIWLSVFLLCLTSKAKNCFIYCLKVFSFFMVCWLPYSGRVLNRFSSDTAYMDSLIPETFFDFLQVILLTLKHISTTCNHCR